MRARPVVHPAAHPQDVAATDESLGEVPVLFRLSLSGTEDRTEPHMDDEPHIIRGYN